MTRHSVRRIVTLGVASLACVAAPGLTALFAAQGPADANEDNVTIIERILVKVNGEIITQTEFEARQVAEIRRQGLQPTSNAELARLVNEMTPGIIASAVDELLIVQRGKEMGWQLSDEQFADIVGNLKAENDLPDDEALAEAMMESEGMTMNDLRTMMERQMLVSQVQQIEVLNKVNMTDTEAREYYDTHLDEFTDPSRATIREILVAVPESASGVNVFADEQARTVAQTTAARVRDGEDFATLAAEISDSPSKANGGMIGPLLVGDYSESIQDFIRELDVGEVTDPIRTPQGYQVIMLVERTAALARPFDQVRESIKQNVFSDRRTAEFSAFLESLREEATVEWKNDDLRLAYERHRETERPLELPF